MLEDVPGLPVGAMVLGKLRVVRALGVGGMGTVYEVEHELTRHRRALKLLHPEHAGNAQVVARFLREASAAGRIGSEHIVETFDAGLLEGGEPYLVMELLDGQSLARMLEETGGLSEGDALSFIIQACDGVQAAHDAGIIHRDIKPDNLFVQRSGRIKILDFGISKFDPLLTGEQQLTGDLTLGTPYYMAPEQTTKSSNVDSRADVYALGVVLYECVTGRKPFQAETYPQLVVQIHLGDFAPASSISATSALLDGVIAKAMARKPEERFQCPRDLAAALRELSTATERAPEPAALHQAAAFHAATPEAGAKRWPAPSAYATTRRAPAAAPVANLAATELEQPPLPSDLPYTAAPPAPPARAASPAAATGNEATLLSAQSEPLPASAPSRRGAGPALAAAVAVVAAVAALWLVLRKPEESPPPPAVAPREVTTTAAREATVVIAPTPAAPPSLSAPPTTSSAPTPVPRGGAKPPSPGRAPDSRASQYGLEQDNPFQ